MASKGWNTALLPLLENSGESLVCPVGYDQFGSLGTTNLQVDSNPPFDIPFIPGPRAQKRNDNGTTYDLAFEDWIDNDFNDFVAHITTYPDGSALITGAGKESGNNFDLIGPDGTDLIYIDNNTWKNVNFLVSAKLSYGINSRCQKFVQDSTKILIVEYHGPVANVVGVNATDTFLGPNGKAAPRHGNRMNILKADGSVETVDPLDIDPADPVKHDRFWKPHLDPALAP